MLIPRIATLGRRHGERTARDARGAGRGDDPACPQTVHCARQGDAETFRELLPQGLPPNLRNHKGDLAMVELLLEHGAEVNASAPDGKTALMFDRTAIPGIAAA